MSDHAKDYLKLHGLFVYDRQQHDSALTAFRENGLSSVCQGAGSPGSSSSLADWMAVAENTLQACGNRGHEVCWIDDGTAFTVSEINSIAGMTDGLTRRDLLSALQSLDAGGHSL